MSAPFDPSKLDLDINNTDNEKLDTSSHEETSSENKEELPAQEAPIVEEVGSIDPLAPQEAAPNAAPISDEDILGTVTWPSEEAQEETKKEKTSLKEMSTEKAPLQESPKVIDINIWSLQELAYILIDESYDFVTIEPSENDVQLSFRQDNVEKSVKYIRYPNYNTILLKIKQVTKLSLDTSDKEQEGKGTIQIKDKTYDVITKTVPSWYGEKVYLKIKENTQKKAVKKTKKTSLGTIFWFLWAVLFVWLILWGAFITFIILNAQTVEDVNFFRSLGINLNDINTFISRVVTFIFSIVLFIETVTLAMFLFKFVWTKKEFKKKRILYGMISTILLLVTFTSASAWMIIDGKIKALPNWQELAYGDIQIYDNSLLTSDAFDKAGALITDTTNMIGPLTIKYDLSLFESNEEKKGFEVKKYIWTIGKETVEELNPTLIKEFNEKGNYEISLIVEEVDLKGEVIQKAVDNIPSLSITHLVDIEEETTTSGGKIVKFDASDVEKLGKVEWYFGNDLETPVWDGYDFKPTQIFFDETIVILSIQDENEEQLNKVFVIWEEKSADIQGEIAYKKSTTNDLLYTLYVTNPETNFGDGFVEEFEWIIGDKSIIQEADPTNLEKSSQIEFEFKNYGANEVTVNVKDSSGKVKRITANIDVPRSMKLKRNLTIWNDDQKMDNIRYLEKANEYFIDDLGIPTTLKFDARFVSAENSIYSLKAVSWDFGNNKNIDGTGKTIEYDVFTEGNHTVAVNFTFVHRKDPSDIVKLKEFIYIEWIKKEAIVNFKIEADTDYVPVTVRFDASKSTIKNDDIVKFEYDYGDGIVEVRDAINPWHKYTIAGDYTVKLTITGRSGRKYSGEKKLILKPEPQDVKIGVSLKKAPVWQGIDFSSDDSDGQITEYFWQFGDGNTSVEANPTHAYTKPWTYSVKLRVDFANNNSLVDEMEISIYDE